MIAHTHTHTHNLTHLRRVAVALIDEWSSSAYFFPLSFHVFISFSDSISLRRQFRSRARFKPFAARPIIALSTYSNAPPSNQLKQDIDVASLSLSLSSLPRSHDRSTDSDPCACAVALESQKVDDSFWWWRRMKNGGSRDGACRGCPCPQRRGRKEATTAPASGVEPNAGVEAVDTNSAITYSTARASNDSARYRNKSIDESEEKERERAEEEERLEGKSECISVSRTMAVQVTSRTRRSLLSTRVFALILWTC